MKILANRDMRHIIDTATDMLSPTRESTPKIGSSATSSTSPRSLQTFGVLHSPSPVEVDQNVHADRQLFRVGLWRRSVRLRSVQNAESVVD
jgi:hypothetical protein